MIFLDGEDTTQSRVYEQLPAPLGGVLGATFEDMQQGTMGRALFRLGDAYGAEHGESPLVTKEDATKEARAAGVALDIADDGIRRDYLDLMIQQKRDHLRRQDILNRSRGGLGTSALQLAVGVAGLATDPLEIGAMFVPVVGQARTAAMLGRASTIVGRTGVRVGVGAVEGAVGASIAESFNMWATRAEGIEYDGDQFLFTVAAGGVLGSFLHAGAGGLADAVGARGSRLDGDTSAAARSASQPPIVRQTAARTAVGQFMDGGDVSIEALIDIGDSAMPAIRAGETPPARAWKAAARRPCARRKSRPIPITSTGPRPPATSRGSRSPASCRPPINAWKPGRTRRTASRLRTSANVRTGRTRTRTRTARRRSCAFAKTTKA